MVDKNDWRIRNQQEYLYGLTLKYKKFVPNMTDHEHCEFCWEKIMGNDSLDVVKEAFTTKDESHWVCKVCFHDFKEMFSWKE
jgi:predicted transposase YbfD/YdcC